MSELDRRIYHIYNAPIDFFTLGLQKMKVEVTRGQVVDTQYIYSDYGHAHVKRVDTRNIGDGWKVKVSEGPKPERTYARPNAEIPVPMVSVVDMARNRVVSNPDTDGFEGNKPRTRDLRRWGGVRNHGDVVRAEYWLPWKVRQAWGRVRGKK